MVCCDETDLLDGSLAFCPGSHSTTQLVYGPALVSTDDCVLEIITFPLYLSPDTHPPEVSSSAQDVNFLKISNDFTAVTKVLGCKLDRQVMIGKISFLL